MMKKWTRKKGSNEKKSVFVHTNVIPLTVVLEQSTEKLNVIDTCYLQAEDVKTKLLA